jgi:DNA polymerase III, delta subunit
MSTPPSFLTTPHHAILFISSNRKEKTLLLWKNIQALSPANVLFDQTVLDIDTARSIITWANTPYHNEKIALLSFHSVSVPAQNAMLKILEEPMMGVRFILVTSTTANLLETVLSRLNLIHESQEKIISPFEEKIRGQAKEFLRTKSSERMNLPYIKKLIVHVDEEGRKDRESVRAFILALISELSISSIKPSYRVKTLEMSSYASDFSASGKTILSYLALLLPQVSL